MPVAALHGQTLAFTPCVHKEARPFTNCPDDLIQAMTASQYHKPRQAYQAPKAVKQGAACSVNTGREPTYAVE